MLVCRIFLLSAISYGRNEDSNHSQIIGGIGTQNITAAHQDTQNNRYNSAGPQNLHTTITTDNVTKNNHINGILDNGFGREKAQTELNP